MNKLVLDIGGSSIKYAIMNETADILERGNESTPLDSFESFISVIRKIYDKYKDDIDGIALSAPGTIDPKSGLILAPGALSFNYKVNLIDKIHEFTTYPVSIENDGKCAALAESWIGNLKNCKSGIVLVLGTGIGGGIILDGKLWSGSHFFAGEFSYLAQGELTGFDNVFALKGSATALVMEFSKAKKIDFSAVDGKKVFELIVAGDEDAISALKKVAHNLALEMYNLQCIFDPEKICIGGGISQQPLLIEEIKKELNTIYSKLPFEVPHVIVEQCMFYNDSNLIGALRNYEFNKKF
ncbi:ROK family protein [Anaerorhabdus sp.]|uniref:ROK family protein n=1 Tax=Anaerorhabdus sp. TaxID=1872524 RepID=UPI002B201FDF|nr:ROK family protein [Anaerorhabdus sp.]MEA4875389.1 ROK family protein [Anaerorhabdus sp.]